MTNHETRKSMNSIEDDWDYLDQMLIKRYEIIEKKDPEGHEIPNESALDEVEDYVDNSYSEKLNDRIAMANNNTEDNWVKTEVEMRKNAINAQDDLLDEFAALDEMLLLANEADPLAVKEEQVMTLEEFDALLGEAKSTPQSEDEETRKQKMASDIFSESLGAASSLEDQLLEEQFTNLLTGEETEKQKEVPKSLLQKVFANVEPEDPEAEIAAVQKAETKKEEEKKKKEKEKQDKKKEKQKAEAKEKKRKEKEEQEKNYVPEGKINRVGASIVFMVAAVFGIVIVVGSLKSSYRLTVDNAAFDATIGRYSQAYEALSGLNLKASEQELYNQVKTVMYLDKQKNSYDNFMELGMEVEALDSLLKGLERYNEYYAQAEDYGVTDQFDKMKTELLLRLKQAYGLSEIDAEKLISESDESLYTEALTKLCGDGK